jgi:protein-L-isoaspartate(D-aspartate) O-methyltransferase
LCKFGKKNVKEFNFMEKGIVEWICGDASQKATFDPVRNEVPDGVDKIIAAAALPARNASHSDAGGDDKIPQEWKDQLKIGGRMVIPIKGSIWLFIKKDNNEFETKEYPGFAFVPFVRKNNE